VPVIGIMDLPVTSERWIGVAGSPTTHNGVPVSVRSCADLSAAILTASNPDFFAAEEVSVLEALKARTAWRIYGGCCMAYGLLANGRTDVAIDTRLKIYDYAPFKPIIEGAGGVITDWTGLPIDLASGPRILAAGDPARHREALAIIAATGVAA
jgi:fructose-1,6-bisphosphatase/inositol monophosphatase family enzyme